MNTHWLELIGKLALLISTESEVHVQDKRIVSNIPEKIELALVGAAPISRRLYQLCLSAQSCNLPVYETVLAMLQDESKPLVLRLGFDDLNSVEHAELSKQPHQPFLHLAQPVLLILAGLIQIPTYVEHLEQIPADRTIIFTRRTLVQIAAGSVPNINILPTGESNGSNEL